MNIDRAILVAMLAAPASACISPATEVSVLVDTDTRNRVTGMRVLVWRGTSTATTPESRTWAIPDAGVTGINDAGGTTMLPASFGVTPGHTPNDGTVTLQLFLSLTPDVAGGPPVTLQRTTRFRFVPHRINVVRLFLPASCGAQIPGLVCRDTTVPCNMSEVCREMSPPQTCGSDGRCAPIDAPGGLDAGLNPNDESTLANGARPAFYECNAHSDCAQGNVCVDNGGDGHFYCKPLCLNNTDCASWPFPRLRCYPMIREDGTVFQHNVCNDNPSVLHAL